MDRIQAMQIFVQVIEKGSFAAAAEYMQLHRPVATRAIQGLERELGVRLLNRTTRRLSVTDEGEDFYQRSIQLLSGLDNAFSNYSNPKKIPSGRLKISIAVTLAKSIVIPALPDFQRQYPQLELHLGVTDQPIDIVQEGIDCVVRLGDLHDSSAVALKIGAVSMVTCASQGYLDAHGRPSNIEQLRAHRAVNFVSGRGKRLVDWTFNDDGEEVRLKLASAVITDDSEALLSCAVAGLGIIQGVRSALSPYIEFGRLIEVLPELPPSQKSISILYPHRAHIPGKTRVFIEWIERLVREG